jgi:DNA-binding PadR family transcriptional regulator
MVEECCPPPSCCDMRGMLSFLILFLLSKKEMYGMELAEGIGRRKAEVPNPGTLYPALKGLEAQGLIKGYVRGKNKYYRLTPKGERELAEASRYFYQAYADVIDEVRRGRLVEV